MGRVRKKLIGLTILLTFVLTTLGSVPGFAWCVGSDGHIEIEYFVTGDCGDRATGASTQPTISKEPSAYYEEEQYGTSVHYNLQTSDTISANRLHLKAPILPDFFPLHNFRSITSQAAKQVVGNLVPQLQPRISRTILEHRTIVLLN
jgi:hypothetical protein